MTDRWWKRLGVKLFGGIVRADREVPLDRAAIDVALRYLGSGAVLAVFPEGRVSHAEATLAPFERGVAYLAMKAQVPVVPVCLGGTAELYLGRELSATEGAARLPPSGPITKEATAAFARALNDDVAALAVPWSEPAGARKRWRCLTEIM